MTLDNRRSQMRIAVMGAGAVGGYLGALLARAGHEVSLIARGRHLQAIQGSGLQVRSEDGNFTSRVQATARPSEIGPVDLVIHAVKTYHNSEAVPMLHPLLGENTTVLCVQNGVDSWEQVQQTLPPNAVLPGAVYIEASVVEPGVVQQQGNVRRLVFGEADGSTTPRIQAIASAMQSAGMPTEISTDITSILWSKWLFITALAGTTCAAHTGLADLLAVPESRLLVVQVLREIDSLGRKLGVNLDSDIVNKTLNYMETEASSLKASMQKDMESGRPMELEALTGAVVRLGKEAKISTPANEAIYALLKPHALRNSGMLTSA